jgi:hypothetical protein
MASRELNVVISKKSEIEIKKAIDKIDETGVSVKELKIDKKVINGISVSILKILVEV